MTPNAFMCLVDETTLNQTTAMLHMSEEHETLINYTEEKPRVIQICRSLTQAALATDQDSRGVQIHFLVKRAAKYKQNHATAEG
jgi:hypothetical protein